MRIDEANSHSRFQDSTLPIVKCQESPFPDDPFSREWTRFVTDPDNRNLTTKPRPTKMAVCRRCKEYKDCNQHQWYNNKTMQQGVNYYCSDCDKEREEAVFTQRLGGYEND